jgi:hypothetical protein
MRLGLQLLGALTLFAATAHAEIEFVGVLVVPGRTLFALSEAPGQPAAWRALGQDFAGYALAEFDGKKDLLTLSKEGATLRLPLKDEAKIKNARVEFSGTVAFGQGEKLDVSRVTLTYDQETVVPLADGVLWRVTPTRLPDGNVQFKLAVERTVREGERVRVQKVSAPSVITLPNSGFRLAVGDLQFNFNPLSPSP